MIRPLKRRVVESNTDSHLWFFRLHAKFNSKFAIPWRRTPVIQPAHICKQYNEVCKVPKPKRSRMYRSSSKWTLSSRKVLSSYLFPPQTETWAILRSLFWKLLVKLASKWNLSSLCFRATGAVALSPKSLIFKTLEASIHHCVCGPLAVDVKRHCKALSPIGDTGVYTVVRDTVFPGKNATHYSVGNELSNGRLCEHRRPG